ncbi:hypothetical protein SETIT_9G106300v2 [Setaria italica]|uniref:Uncharacterized protein n=1 Tax=Setaria italica TaxID=4555 RepID=A0A368SF46_SETIT|nr:hypothetical protein SETIT_9G106300v2 [Setaria italica]
MEWRQALGILYDKRVPLKLKGKRHVQQLSVAEMRTLRWICGHTRRDRVQNEDIRDSSGVAPIEEKLIQHRLRWFGHVQ